MKSKELGNIGEEMACEFIIKKGYRILERNYWKKFGEIDIIGIAPDQTLVFIEVKLLLIKKGGKSRFSPEDNFTTQKRQKVNRICEFFAAAHEEFIDEEKGWRLDLVAIEFFEREKFIIRHYENV